MSRLITVLSFCYLTALAGVVWLAYHPEDRSYLAWINPEGNFNGATVVDVVTYGDEIKSGAGSGSHAFNELHRTNRPAVEIIKSYEGLRLEAYAEADYFLIGYGHKNPEITSGMTITEDRAEAYLRSDLKVTEQIVRTSVKVPLNENEFSALSILAYNIGSGAFWNSTVLRLLNEDNRLGAADAFLMWNKISQDGELQVSTNLSERRAAERDLFLAKPDDFQGPS